MDGWIGWPADLAARYRAAGYWQGETLGGFLDRIAAEFGDRVAIVDGARRWSYRELDARAGRLAAGLRRLGVAPADRVVVQLGNTAEFAEVCFGLWRLGAIPVMALPAHRGAEIAHLCAHTAAVAYVFAGRGAAGAAARVPTVRWVVAADRSAGPWLALDDLREAPGPDGRANADAGGVALLQLSGGTTGVPKLIPRTHDDYLYSARASAQACRLGRDSGYLVALPVAHNFPLSSPGVLGTLSVGGRLVFAPAPSPEVAFPLIAREGVTITAVVPPLAQVWLRAAAAPHPDLSSLRVLQVGGAPLPAAVARQVRPVLGCALQQVFGMAEGLLSYTDPDDPDEVAVAGHTRPLSPADEIRIVDDEDREVPPGASGHLLTRGPYTIRGYYRADAHNRTAFTPDGFYRTGDLARRTAGGRLAVTGRAKNQINRGGEKVAAEEVEQHLLAHPRVRQAVVVGTPDPFLGERTRALVVPAPAPAEPPSPAALRAFLRERGLATYKIPDQVTFVDAIPETGVGKLSRTELTEGVPR
ncbi:AMP-binding protein [Actinomycetes bacterium KLBMP 9797]